MPSHPPPEKQWDRYIYFLEERVLSSEQEHDENAYINLMFALGQHVIRTRAQTDEGWWRRRILGYCMTGAFFDFSKVVTFAKEFVKKNGKKKNR